MLSGLRVIDCTDARAFLAGKILGDLGASVVKVEPPGGDPARRRGPFLGAARDPEKSLPWVALNTSKRGIVLDLQREVGRARLRRLLSRTDVLLESFAPGALAALGLGFEALHAEFPALVHCAITPYGQSGPRANWHGDDLTVVAMGGNLAVTGQPGMPPVRCTLPTSSFHACPEAVLGILMALEARAQTGLGQQVDVSLQECQLASLMASPASFVASGRLAQRTGGRMGRTREIWAAKDGWVSFGLRGGPTRIPNLQATVAYMDECGMAPEWLRAFDWSGYDPNALPEEEIERLEEVFGAFFRTRTMRELYQEALARRILLAPCNNAREVLEHVQLRDRQLFTTLPLAAGGTTECPACFGHASRYALRPSGRAPRLAEHQDEVLGELEGGEGAKPAEGTGSALSPRGVYAGLKILELGAGAAGPLITKYFAEQGARVIRVESRKRPDFLRLLAFRRDDPDCLEKVPMFVLLNPDKESVTLNLREAEGVALAKRLVGWADVVVENFAPGVMARLGLGAATLEALNPTGIFLSSSLFGQTGPQRQYPGFGGQGSAIAGFNHLTGRPESEAHGPWGTITDSLSPRYAALLLAAALRERRQSGQGQRLDVSQIEAAVYSLSEWIVEQSVTGQAQGRLGSRDRIDAPHGCYPAAGEDRWIALAVHSDAEWEALRGVLGDPAWARDPCYASAPGRLAAQDVLDAALSAWTAAQPAAALAEKLQGVGLDAAPVQDCRDLLADPQLAHRGHFVPLGHRFLGEVPFERAGFRLAASPGGFERPGPLLGEHNDAVLQGLLGLSPQEVERLTAAEVIL